MTPRDYEIAKELKESLSNSDHILNLFRELKNLKYFRRGLVRPGQKP